ncbi:MAG: porin family protein [Tannerellaceae bacterium]|nr:porin family protein [Tannerellaceae bacterium]
MKRLVFIFVIALSSLGAFSQTTGGDSSFGFNLGYGFDSKNPLLGIDYRYNFTDEVRFAPSLSFLVRNNDLSACAVDLNVHYVVKITEMFGFYPVAGVDLSFWKQRWHHDVGEKGSSNHTRFGVNLGLGGELYATGQLSAGLEIKYNIIKDFDQAIIGLRIGYSF